MTTDNKSSKIYKVWICIEEHDEETDTYTELDAPGSAVATFDSYPQAYSHAATLQIAGRLIVGQLKQRLAKILMMIPGWDRSMERAKLTEQYGRLIGGGDYIGKGGRK